MGKARRQRILVALSLGFGRRRDRVGAGGHAEEFPPAIGRQGEDRLKRRRLKQFSGCGAVCAHHDFGPFGDVAAIQQPCHLKRFGVGVDGVVVRGHGGEGAVGAGGVEVLPGDRAVAEDLIVDGAGEQQRIIGACRRIVGDGGGERICSADLVKIQKVQLSPA